MHTLHWIDFAASFASVVIKYLLLKRERRERMKSEPLEVFCFQFGMYSWISSQQRER